MNNAKFSCKVCKFCTNHRGNYNDHLKTTKHIKNKNKEIVTEVKSECKPKPQCKSIDNNLQELVTLMQLKMKQQDIEINLHKIQINKLTEQIRINDSFNTIINNNITLLVNKQDNSIEK